MRDNLYRASWTYGRGWLVVLVLYLAGRAISKAYSQVAVGIEPMVRSLESAVPNAILVVTILILGPWVVGRALELFLSGRLFQRQRGFRAFQRMEKRLTTELNIDDRHGYRVALVNWPSPETRSLGLIVEDFVDPGTGRELAAVFFPNTPDPTKGAIRVVAAEDLQLTDWGLSDLARFHVTFGSAAPDLTDSEK